MSMPCGTSMGRKATSIRASRRKRFQIPRPARWTSCSPLIQRAAQPAASPGRDPSSSSSIRRDPSARSAFISSRAEDHRFSACRAASCATKACRLICCGADSRRQSPTGCGRPTPQKNSSGSWKTPCSRKATVVWHFIRQCSTRWTSSSDHVALIPSQTSWSGLGCRRGGSSTCFGRKSGSHPRRSAGSAASRRC